MADRADTPKSSIPKATYTFSSADPRKAVRPLDPNAKARGLQSNIAFNSYSSPLAPSRQSGFDSVKSRMGQGKSNSLKSTSPLVGQTRQASLDRTSNLPVPKEPKATLSFLPKRQGKRSPRTDTSSDVWIEEASASDGASDTISVRSMNSHRSMAEVMRGDSRQGTLSTPPTDYHSKWKVRNDRRRSMDTLSIYDSLEVDSVEEFEYISPDSLRPSSEKFEGTHRRTTTLMNSIPSSPPTLDTSWMPLNVNSDRVSAPSNHGLSLMAPKTVFEHAPVASTSPQLSIFVSEGVATEPSVSLSSPTQRLGFPFSNAITMILIVVISSIHAFILTHVGNKISEIYIVLLGTLVLCIALRVSVG